MSLAQRISDLAARIAAEFKLVREEIATREAAGGPAGGVLGGTYPNPKFATNVLFEGRGLLSSAIITDGLDLRGVNNKMSVGSLLTMQDKTSGSTNPPSVTADYEVTPDLGEYLWRLCGLHMNSTELELHAAGFFFGSGMLRYNEKHWNIPSVVREDNSSDSVHKPYTATRIQNPAGGRTITWGEEWIPGTDPAKYKMGGIYLRSWDDAPLLTNQPAILKSTPFKTHDFTYFGGTQLGRCFSATGAARANEFCAAHADTWNGQLKLRRWTAADDGAFTLVQETANIATPWFIALEGGQNEGLRGVAFGSSQRMGFHGNNQDVWVVFSKIWAYVYNAAGTARLPDLEFPAAADQVNFTIGDLATNDYAGFRGIPHSDKIPVTRYTDITWPNTDPSLWWVGYTWYDSVGVVHETNLSVPASITMKKRARLSVDVGPLPDPADGAGAARKPDDVNSFRLYIARSPTVPPSNQYWRQSTQPAPLATKVYLTTNPVTSGAGLNPPTATNFPGAGPAAIQSSAISDIDGTPKFILRADGRVELETLDVGGNAAGSLTGRAFDQMAYTHRFQATMTGGGKRTVAWSSPNAYLTWSSRFLVTGIGRGSTLATAGYFQIDVPPAGTVVNGYGGATNKTASGQGIPLANYEQLWYELPYGSAQTSLPGNFRVTNYTSDFTIPHNWVLIAWSCPESGVALIQWGDGIRTTVPGWYDVAAPTPGLVIARYADTVGPYSNPVPNGGGDWYAYDLPNYTVPAGARTLHILMHPKGKWTTNAACYWYMNINYGTVAQSRVHNAGDPGQTADSVLFAIVNVNPGDNINCDIVVNNDPGSGSYLYLVQSSFSMNFMS